MMDKILFVDDESLALSGCQRLLHREFDVGIALDAEQGLASIQKNGPYAVVISDMRMPGMNGAQFLSQVRQKAPDTVRMLLTGYTDLNAAMDAVNEGNIFRFLTKPCEKELLAKAIATGVEQYRLVRTEKDLLEKTLMGCIKVLMDVLSAASPEAFGKSRRIAHCVRHLVLKLLLTSTWLFDTAAALSQLGYVTLDTDLIRQAYTDTRMSPEDQARFDAHPQAGMNLLAHIPRLEPVAWMIGQQLKKNIPNVVPGVPEPLARDIVLGTKILKIALAFDKLRMKRFSVEDAIAQLHIRRSEFERNLVDALSDFVPPVSRMAMRKIPTLKLAVGMIVEQEIRSAGGLLLVAKAQEITPAVLAKLENLAIAGQLDKEIMALVPV
jgi:response regulator RpfG family c-di-GMP phosphodiesterase